MEPHRMKHMNNSVFPATYAPLLFMCKFSQNKEFQSILLISMHNLQNSLVGNSNISDMDFIQVQDNSHTTLLILLVPLLLFFLNLIFNSNQTKADPLEIEKKQLQCWEQVSLSSMPKNHLITH